MEQGTITKHTPKEKILYIEYYWEDDRHQGNNVEAFIGTWSEFQDYAKNLQELWGFNYWDLTSKPANKAQIELMKRLRE